MDEFNAPALDVSMPDVSHDEIVQDDAPPAPPENPYKGTKHKFKAGGRELEVDYDELIQKASLAEGANQKFSEAKALKQQFEDRLGKLSDADSENWDEIIELLGVEKALKFASKVKENESYWSELSDEEREELVYRQQAEAALQELDALKGKQKQEAQQAASREAYAAINQEIGDALAEAKLNGVPLADLPDIALAVVDEMLAVLEEMEKAEKEGKKWSGKPPSAKDVVKKLGAQYDERSTTYIKKLSAKQLKSMLSPEQLAELRQEEIDSLYAGATPSRMTKPVDAAIKPFDPSQNQSESRPLKTKDWFKEMDKKLGVRR